MKKYRVGREKKKKIDFCMGKEFGCLKVEEEDLNAMKVSECSTEGDQNVEAVVNRHDMKLISNMTPMHEGRSIKDR